MGGVSVFCMENPILLPEKPRGKSSLFVSLAFLRVLLFLGTFVYRVLWGELRLFIVSFLGPGFFVRV